MTGDRRQMFALEVLGEIRGSWHDNVLEGGMNDEVKTIEEDIRKLPYIRMNIILQNNNKLSNL